MTIDRRTDYYKRCVSCGLAFEAQLNERYRRGLQYKQKLLHHWHVMETKGKAIACTY